MMCESRQNACVIIFGRRTLIEPMLSYCFQSLNEHFQKRPEKALVRMTVSSLRVRAVLPLARIEGFERLSLVSGRHCISSDAWQCFRSPPRLHVAGENSSRFPWGSTNTRFVWSWLGQFGVGGHLQQPGIVEFGRPDAADIASNFIFNCWSRTKVGEIAREP